MAKKEKKHPQESKVYEESFGEGTITIQEIAPDTARWKVIDFHNMDLRKLSKAIFKLLRDKKDCYTISLNGVRVSKSYTKDEIFQELSNSISEERLREIFLS